MLQMPNQTRHNGLPLTPYHPYWHLTILREGQNSHTVQEFTWMVNFYHKFIPHTAHTMLPLFEPMKGKPNELIWNKTRQKAFEDTKKLLADATLLAHPHQDAELALTCDASDYTITTVFQQFVDNTWIPLAFFSQKLKPAEPKVQHIGSQAPSPLSGNTVLPLFLQKSTIFSFHRPQTSYVQHVQTNRASVNSTKRNLSLSSPLIFDTLLERRMQLQTPCQDLQSLECIWESITMTWLYPNNSTEVKSISTNSSSLRLKEIPVKSYAMKPTTLLRDICPQGRHDH